MAQSLSRRQRGLFRCALFFIFVFTLSANGLANTWFNDREFNETIQQRIPELLHPGVTPSVSFSILGNSLTMHGRFTLNAIGINGVTGRWNFIEGPYNHGDSSNISAGNLRIDGLRVRISNSRTNFQKDLSVSFSARWFEERDGSGSSYFVNQEFMSKAEFEALPTNARSTFSFSVIQPGQFSADSYPIQAVSRFVRQMAAANASVSTTPRPNNQTSQRPSRYDSGGQSNSGSASSNDALVREAERINRQSRQAEAQIYQSAQQLIDMIGPKPRLDYDDEDSGPSKQELRARRSRELEEAKREESERLGQRLATEAARRQADKDRVDEKNKIYREKGGDANWEKQLATYRTQEADLERRLLADLSRHDGGELSESLDLGDACGLSNSIARVLTSSMPPRVKDQYIKDILRIRISHYATYRQYAHADVTFNSAVMGNENPACLNYLTYVSNLLMFASNSVHPSSDKPWLGLLPNSAHMGNMEETFAAFGLSSLSKLGAHRYTSLTSFLGEQSVLQKLIGPYRNNSGTYSTGNYYGIWAWLGMYHRQWSEGIEGLDELAFGPLHRELVDYSRDDHRATLQAETARYIGGYQARRIHDLIEADDFFRLAYIEYQVNHAPGAAMDWLTLYLASQRLPQDQMSLSLADKPLWTWDGAGQGYPNPNAVLPQALLATVLYMEHGDYEAALAVLDAMKAHPLREDAWKNVPRFDRGYRRNYDTYSTFLIRRMDFAEAKLRREIRFLQGDSDVPDNIESVDKLWSSKGGLVGHSDNNWDYAIQRGIAWAAVALRRGDKALSEHIYNKLEQEFFEPGMASKILGKKRVFVGSQVFLDALTELQSAFDPKGKNPLPAKLRGPYRLSNCSRWDQFLFNDERIEESIAYGCNTFLRPIADADTLPKQMKLDLSSHKEWLSVRESINLADDKQYLMLHEIWMSGMREMRLKSDRNQGSLAIAVGGGALIRGDWDLSAKAFLSGDVKDLDTGIFRLVAYMMSSPIGIQGHLDYASKREALDKALFSWRASLVKEYNENPERFRKVMDTLFSEWAKRGVHNPRMAMLLRIYSEGDYGRLQ